MSATQGIGAGSVASRAADHVAIHLMRAATKTRTSCDHVHITITERNSHTTTADFQLGWAMSAAVTDGLWLLGPLRSTRISVHMSSDSSKSSSSGLIEQERSRVEPIRRAEEDEARQMFLSRRRRSPTFVLDPPPHLIPPPTPSRHAQQLVQRRAAESPPPLSTALLPTRPYRAERGDDEHSRRLQNVRAYTAFDSYPRRPPPLRTPSPPHTPIALSHLTRPSRLRLYDEEAFFHNRHIVPQYSALAAGYPSTAAGYSDRLVPWIRRSMLPITQPGRLPAAGLPPRLRLPAEPSINRRFVATSGGHRPATVACQPRPTSDPSHHHI